MSSASGTPPQRVRGIRLACDPGAAATRTQNIRLTSAVTVLSAADPIESFRIRHSGPDLPWAGRNRRWTRLVNRGLSAFRFRLRRSRLTFLRELELS